MQTYKLYKYIHIFIIITTAIIIIIIFIGTKGKRNTNVHKKYAEPIRIKDGKRKFV